MSELSKSQPTDKLTVDLANSVAVAEAAAVAATAAAKISAKSSLSLAAFDSDDDDEGSDDAYEYEPDGEEDTLDLPKPENKPKPAVTGVSEEEFKKDPNYSILSMDIAHIRDRGGRVEPTAVSRIMADYKELLGPEVKKSLQCTVAIDKSSPLLWTVRLANVGKTYYDDYIAKGGNDKDLRKLMFIGEDEKARRASKGIYFTENEMGAMLHMDMQDYAKVATDPETGKPCTEFVIVIHFPPNYPNKPPFMYVRNPITRRLSGHITVGGAICMESLIEKNWRPITSINQLLMQFRLNVVLGGGRLYRDGDHPHRGSNTYSTAQDGFARLKNFHRKNGWGKAGKG